MPEKCNTNDCPLFPRVDALERANEQHSKTHREIFDRMREVEKENAVQNAHYKVIDEKLDKLILWQEEQRARLEKIDDIAELSTRLSALESKPGKRWDGVVDKFIYGLVGAFAVSLFGGLMWLLAKVSGT